MTSQSIDRPFVDEEDGIPDPDRVNFAPFSLGAGLPEEDVGSCQSKQIYVDSGNDKKVLFMLSIGLRVNNEPLFSVDEEPWSTLPKNMLRPRNNGRLCP
jgi:hypothetical protein